jgi:hypothetical protein
MTLKKFISDSKMFEYGKHYTDCQQNNQPFIKGRINPSTSNYYVQIDMMTCNYNLSLDGQNHIKELFENEVALLQSDPNQKLSFKGYNVDKELSWFDGVLPTRLSTFCEKLYELSEKYPD